MKTIKLTLLAVAAVLGTALNSCRKDASPAPVASELRDSSAMGPLALRHFRCHDPKKTLSEGLLAYYPFSGNANDWSGNGYNAAVTGATLTTGKYGCQNSAYSFNGTSDYVVFPFTYGSGKDTLSVYARIKRGANGTLFSKGSMYRARQTILRVSSDSTSVSVDLSWVDLIHYINPPYPFAEGGEVSVSLPLAPHDCWEDIAVILDYPILKIYINGKLLTSGHPTETVGDITIDVWPLFDWLGGTTALGAYATHFEPDRGFLTGVVDEMRFYKRALTQQEIDYLYRH